LRCDVLRALVIRRALVVNALELELQLTLTLLGCLEFSTMGCKLGFIVLGCPCSFFLATLLLLLLHLALSNLLLKST
jgi:hypothetical protein